MKTFALTAALTATALTTTSAHAGLTKMAVTTLADLAAGTAAEAALDAVFGTGDDPVELSQESMEAIAEMVGETVSAEFDDWADDEADAALSNAEDYYRYQDCVDDPSDCYSWAQDAIDDLEDARARFDDADGDFHKIQTYVMLSAVQLAMHDEKHAVAVAAGRDGDAENELDNYLTLAREVETHMYDKLDEVETYIEEDYATVSTVWGYTLLQIDGRDNPYYLFCDDEQCHAFLRTGVADPDDIDSMLALVGEPTRDEMREAILGEDFDDTLDTLEALIDGLEGTDGICQYDEFISGGVDCEALADNRILLSVQSEIESLERRAESASPIMGVSVSTYYTNKIERLKAIFDVYVERLS